MQNNSADKKPSLSWSTPAVATPAVKALTSQKLPMTMAGSGNTSRYVGIFAAGLIVGFLLSWGYTAATHPSGVTTATTSGTPKTVVKTNNTPTTVQGSDAVAAGVVIGQDGMAHSNAALSISSPQRAGLSVAVSDVEVTVPTWVVVYESQNGEPGNVLGAHLFFASGAGTVTLLRSTVAGHSYFVGTSPDNGDRKYSKSADKPAMFEDGSIEVTGFTSN
ncbi:MAG: hypothetical protein V4474_00460 [Patescibacteria group bacterium]